MLSKLSIKRKLTLIIVTTSGLAVLTACLAVGIYEHRRTTAALVRETTQLAVILGSHSEAALAFRDTAAAEDFLSALAVDDRVTSAAIFDDNEQVFASYGRSPLSGLVVRPAMPGSMASAFRAEDLVVVRDMVVDGETIAARLVSSGSWA